MTWAQNRARQFLLLCLLVCLYCLVCHPLTAPHGIACVKCIVRWYLLLNWVHLRIARRTTAYSVVTLPVFDTCIVGYRGKTDGRPVLSGRSTWCRNWLCPEQPCLVYSHIGFTFIQWLTLFAIQEYEWLCLFMDLSLSGSIWNLKRHRPDRPKGVPARVLCLVCLRFVCTESDTRIWKMYYAVGFSVCFFYCFFFLVLDGKTERLGAVLDSIQGDPIDSNSMDFFLFTCYTSCQYSTVAHRYLQSMFKYVVAIFFFTLSFFLLACLIVEVLSFTIATLRADKGKVNSQTHFLNETTRIRVQI